SDGASGVWTNDETEPAQAHPDARGAHNGLSAASGSSVPRGERSGVPHPGSPGTPSDTALPASVTDAERARVLDALGPAPADVDSVARATGLAIQSVHVALLELNLGGHILRYPGGLVARVPGTDAHALTQDGE